MPSLRQGTADVLGKPAVLHCGHPTSQGAGCTPTPKPDAKSTSPAGTARKVSDSANWSLGPEALPLRNFILKRKKEKQSSMKLNSASEFLSFFIPACIPTAVAARLCGTEGNSYHKGENFLGLAKKFL